MIRTLLLLVALLSQRLIAFAAPLPSQDVPEPLRPWVKWALHGYKENDCPFFSNGAGQATCTWPARLEFKLHARGGEFTQQWQVFTEEWVSLPGERDHWPQEVKLDSQPIVVRESGGVPQVRVQPGNHTVSGVFLWDTLPQSLQVPLSTGLVALTLDNKMIDFPQIDDSGKLWLRQGAAEQEQVEDRLDLKVYRRITDGIPLMVTIQIDLQVSGKQREVILGQAISAEYIPLSLNSVLPARLESDGQLRVQVRAGQWAITLTARHTAAALTSIPLPAVTEGQWPEEEVWVFEAQPHLRQVTLDEALSIDAQQTTLPPEWRSFPAYILKAGGALQLTEKKRGDPEPAPDQLTLQRQWWLDFDGRGYTVQDSIAGTMTRGWRLDLPAPGTLGRAAVDGQEQFITKSDQSERAGIELRRGQVALVADSRLEAQRPLVPTVGWDHDFHQVSGLLHLPPGWRVLTATGVDFMPDTWLDRWTLMDLFVVFLIALAVGKLWGWLWGGVALAALALITHESGAPWWMWLHVLIATALLRVLPVGWPRHIAFAYRFVALLTLLVIAGTFMIRQARLGFYPQLEGFERGETQVVFMGAAPQSGERPQGMSRPAQRPTVQSQMAQDESMIEGMGRGLGGVDTSGTAAPWTVTVIPSEGQKYSYNMEASSTTAINVPQRPLQYDPNAAIQTGPGLPRWQWNTFSLSWNGPVERTQEVHFFLFSPRVNLVLALLRILLVAALLVCVFDVRYSNDKLSLPSLPTTTTATIVVLLLFLAISLPSFAQQMLPSLELLNELRAKLTTKEPPQCGPQCATSPRLQIEIVGETLRLRQEIHAATHVALPLPGRQRHWLPRTILLDGTPARAVSRENGQLWIALPEGQHHVLMEGPLPVRDSVELLLPIHPYFVQVAASGWEVDGVHEDGVADDQLQLRRVRNDTSQAEVTLESGTLPPFVRVERTVQLGLTWGVQTRVLRVSPRGSAAVVAIPLLEGESVTTSGVRVESGKALVNMSPNDTEMRWSSVLEPRTQLTLKAPETTAWTEIWKLDVSPIWRVTPTGIPVVHHSDQASGHWLPEWRPWPGETVAFQIARPEGLPGQTLTVDSSLLQVTPGRRATDVLLQVTLRSSRGGQHRITLPESVTLQSVNINGVSQAIRQEGRTVTVPVSPGTQEINMAWRQANGITSSYTTPQVDLGSSSVNASLQVHMPPDRWTLFCRGPQLGPAVLFWSAAFVIMLGAVALGRIPMTPLRTHHWILLGIGFSTVYIKMMLLVVGWLFALEFRKRLTPATPPLLFNVIQLALIALTVLALGTLVFVVQQGLMGAPEMRIFGNGSSNLFLHWYQDRTDPIVPQGWIFSLPLWTYRLAMLAWALWLVSVLISWLRWGWECFSTNGLWRKRERIVPSAREGKLVPPASTEQPSEG